MFEDELEKYQYLSKKSDEIINQVAISKGTPYEKIKWYMVKDYIQKNNRICIVPIKHNLAELTTSNYGLYGATMKMGNYTLIEYNDLNIKERQHFTIMHEISHFILHKNDQTYPSLMQENDYSENDKQNEKEANMMAGMLLANKKAIQSLLDDRKPFIYLCKYFGISKPALKIRLFNLFYFQTLEQVIKEEKQIEDLYAYSHKTINNYIYYNYKLTIN